MDVHEELGGPCEICGIDPSDCQCPECTVCNTNGRIQCLLDHSMGLPIATFQTALRRLIEVEKQAVLTQCTLEAVSRELFNERCDNDS